MRHFMLSESEWIFRLDEQEMMNEYSMLLHLMDHHGLYSLHTQKIKWKQFKNLRRISDLIFLCNGISFSNSVCRNIVVYMVTVILETILPDHYMNG